MYGWQGQRSDVEGGRRTAEAGRHPGPWFFGFHKEPRLMMQGRGTYRWASFVLSLGYRYPSRYHRHHATTVRVSMRCPTVPVASIGTVHCGEPCTAERPYLRCCLYMRRLFLGFFFFLHRACNRIASFSFGLVLALNGRSGPRRSSVSGDMWGSRSVQTHEEHQLGGSLLLKSND